MCISVGTQSHPFFGCAARTAYRASIVVAGLLAVSGASAATAPSALTLAEAESLALQDEPGALSLQARSDALRDRAVVAAQLPDPTLRFGIMNFPIESGGFATEAMTQATVGLRQAFPPAGSREAQTRMLDVQAGGLAANAALRLRDILQATRSAWLEVYYWDRADAIVAASRPFFEDLVAITESLYAVGQKDQQDLLRAELELSRLQDRLIDVRGRQAGARAMLSNWVGSASTRPMPEQLPRPLEVPDLAVLESRLEQHPALNAANAAVLAGRAGEDLAQARFRPGWALDLSYGYRDGVLANGDSRSDFVSVSFSVDLPVFRARRQDRTLQAATRERRAADQSREEVRRRLRSRLSLEYARWRDLTRRVDLYDRVILAQAENRASAALSAYRSDAGDFADLMRARIDQLTIRLDHMRLRVDLAQSETVLENLGGNTP